MNAKIGQTLRDSRKAQHYTLEQVHEAIRINPTYLEAMESGNFDALPSSSHAKGFFRNYARFLKLDADELLEQIRNTPTDKKGRKLPKESTVPFSAPEKSPFYESKGLDIVPSRKAGPSGDALLRWVIGLAILGAIGIVAYGLFADDRDIDILNAIPNMKEGASTVADVDNTALVATAEAESADDLTKLEGSEIIETTNNILPIEEEEVTPVVNVADVENLSLEALGVPQNRIDIEIEVLSDRSILIIEADGKTVFQQQVTKEDAQLTFSAVQSLTLKSGNAGALRLSVNGSMVGVLGQIKQPFEYTWTTDNPAPAEGTEVDSETTEDGLEVDSETTEDG